MTEAEAKTQLCIGPKGVGQYTNDGYVCRGAACKMAWRWIDGDTEWSGTYTSRPQPAGEGWQVQIERGDRYGRWMRRKPPTEGYCGLAGKP